MSNTSNEAMRLIIELSPSVQDADEYITKHLGDVSFIEKNKYVNSLFNNVQIVTEQVPPNQSEEDHDRDDYYYMLHAIVNMKWR